MPLLRIAYCWRTNDTTCIRVDSVMMFVTEHWHLTWYREYTNYTNCLDRLIDISIDNFAFFWHFTFSCAPRHEFHPVLKILIKIYLLWDFRKPLHKFIKKMKKMWKITISLITTVIPFSVSSAKEKVPCLIYHLFILTLF